MCKHMHMYMYVYKYMYICIKWTSTLGILHGRGFRRHPQRDSCLSAFFNQQDHCVVSW